VAVTLFTSVPEANPFDILLYMKVTALAMANGFIR
jgi:hypothetical protein